MPAMAAELLAAVHLPPVPDLPAPLPPRPTAVPGLGFRVFKGSLYSEPEAAARV